MDWIIQKINEPSVFLPIWMIIMFLLIFMKAYQCQSESNSDRRIHELSCQIARLEGILISKRCCMMLKQDKEVK